MRRFLCFAGTILLAVSAWAGQGVPPRQSSSDYPVHLAGSNSTIAAALVPADIVRKLFPANLSKDFIVVEVAVFPQEGQTVYIDSFDFGLKLGDAEISYPRTPDEVVSAWVDQSAPLPPNKVDVTTETGVVYNSGNDPVNGRSRGWATYTGVAVGQGQPTPPRPLSADPRVVEANVRAKALPEGAVALPVAGYLYFPVHSKKSKNAAKELQYHRDGVLLQLPFPAK